MYYVVFLRQYEYIDITNYFANSPFFIAINANLTLN
jgi:hypothetical protein